MTETTTKEYRLATNEAVMRALGISHLREIAYAKLTMIPGELPMLTLDMYIEETPPECHLPPLGGFDLDKACSEAMERVQSHIRITASAAREETKNAFYQAQDGMLRRWSEGPIRKPDGSISEYINVTKDIAAQVSKAFRFYEEVYG